MHPQAPSPTGLPASVPIRRAGRPSGQGRTRLFCLPPAGAGASIFYPWLDAAPPWLEICPVAVPGREDQFRQPLPASIHALADALSDALAPALDRPYAVLGYSMGAFVGYELVQRWSRRGWRTPDAFFALAARSPTAPFDREEPLHLLNAARFREALIDMGGTPREILDNAEAMALFEPILRNDLRIAETYRPTGPDTAKLACTVHAIYSHEDALVEPHHAKAWAECSTQPLTEHVITGPHMPSKTALLALLPELTRALKPDTSR
ncbi:MAG: thioesterase II family protein [Pseudomonadota bacterium]